MNTKHEIIEVFELRKRLGWSREKLASELGISFFTLQKWELGNTRPSPLAQEKIDKLIETKGLDRIN